jgi:Fe-S cluster assembly iron-binding protein IscA
MVTMLTLTNSAAEALATARSQQGIPDDATLRVAAAPAGNGEQPGITIGFVDRPMDGDETGDAHGMPICVAPEVADTLADAKIDTQTEGDQTRLVLVPGE